VVLLLLLLLSVWRIHATCTIYTTLIALFGTIGNLLFISGHTSAGRSSSSSSSAATVTDIAALGTAAWAAVLLGKALTWPYHC
jgi:hypothetical protein